MPSDLCIGHVNIQMLKSMQTQSIVAGLLKFRVDGMQKVCEACQMGKQARHAFPHNVEVSNRKFGVIHLDVWTTKVASLGGCYYYVSFIDNHTRKVWVYFMKNKSEVLNHFKVLKVMVEEEKGT